MASFATLQGPRSLSRRKLASANAVLIAFAAYAGETVKRLQREELQLCKDFAAPDTTIEQRVAIVRALDIIRDRRRIVLGIPLPGPRAQRTLTLAPDGPVDVDLVPELAQSISQATSSSAVPVP